MVPVQDGMVRTEPADAMKLWVRGALAALALGLIGLFAVAAWLNPYDGNGQPLKIATHRQLGLPECNFVRWFGRPCPTCGMTTSFALLMHGEVGASLRANFAGTLLAVMLLAAVPWVLHTAFSGRWRWVRWPERWVLGGAILAAVVTIGRWTFLVGVPWLLGYG